MVVDIGTVKNHIKPKADSTLLNMRKADLIKYIRTLENNYNVAVSFNENQARYIESLDAVPVIRCKDCANACPGNRSLVCTIWGAGTSPDGFCNHGERRIENGSGTD